MKITLYELTNVLGTDTKINLFKNGKLACDPFAVYQYGSDFKAQDFGTFEIDCIDAIGKNELNIFLKNKF